MGDHERIPGLALHTKAELKDIAKAHGMSGYSTMTREELFEAVRERLREQADGEQPPGDDDARKLQEKNKDELYELASERDISGRSHMSKGELVNALQQHM